MYSRSYRPEVETHGIFLMWLRIVMQWYSNIIFVLVRDIGFIVRVWGGVNVFV